MHNQESSFLKIFYPSILSSPLLKPNSAYLLENNALFRLDREKLLLIFFAGTPPHVVEGSSIFLTTTALAPIATLSAIVTFPITYTPEPRKQLSPIWAASKLPFVVPIVIPS